MKFEKKHIEKVSERSPEYLRRKSQLLRARIWLVSLVSLSLTLLVILSLGEAWATRILMSSPLTWFELLSVGVLIGVFLFVYCIILARMALHITYHTENARVAQTFVTTLCLVVYAFLFTYLHNPLPVVFLAASKLLAIFLFFLFWQSQLSETRLRLRSRVLPRIYIVSWKAFFVSRWVLAACWLLCALGIALALVSTHPIIELDGWEGVSLLVTFYLLFRIFVRNPNAHAGYRERGAR